MLAQCTLGQAHAHAQLGLPPSSQQAVRWYTAAAEQGNAKAMWGLGVMHRDGVAGLKRNLREAIAWLRKGAELGCAEAQSDLGHAHMEGGGVPHSIEQALPLTPNLQDTKP